MQVLLHICCAVCAAPCVERLRQEGHQPFGFFYNPNIHPQDEYFRRLNEVKRLANQQNFSLIVGDYKVDDWFSQIRGLEKEPEGGKRCKACFRLRLKKTLETARQKGFRAFTSTLTVSPHKNSRVINQVGQILGCGLFLVRDFKKQDGFKRAQLLAKRYNFYQQDYCGCSFSLKERQKNERLHKETRSGRTKD